MSIKYNPCLIYIQMFEFINFYFHSVSHCKMAKQSWTDSCCHNRNILAHLMDCVGFDFIKVQLHT